MADHESFNTDTRSLQVRMATNQRLGSRDFDAWTMELIAPALGQRILDLGCGTGKQTLPMAEVVGESGHVVAVDVASAALAELTQAAQQQGLEARVTAVHADLDCLSGHAESGSFDRVVGCYSLYYAHKPDVLLQTIHRALREAGSLFFCGPAHDNNAELKRFQYELRGQAPPPPVGHAAFMEDVGRPLAEKLFGHVECFHFENLIRFDSAAALLTYWRSHNLHDPELEPEFLQAAELHFQRHDAFDLWKRVLGVRATSAGTR